MGHLCRQQLASPKGSVHQNVMHMPFLMEVHMSSVGALREVDEVAKGYYVRRFANRNL